MDTDSGAPVSRRPSLAEPAPYVPRTRRWALVIVVVGSFIAAAFIAAPLWIALVFGGVMAISAYRPYRWLCRRLGEKRGSLAAALVTLGAGLLLVVVGRVVLLALTNELIKLVGPLNERGNMGVAGLIGPRATVAIEKLGVDTVRLYTWAQKELEAAASLAASTAALALRTTSQAVLGLVVALMTMYYMLREGPGLALRIERIAPLEPRHTRELLTEARDVGRSAFIGTIATGLIQGVLGGIGYVAMGVPHAITWGVVTALASFLPVIGTLTVWVPIAAFLFMEGHPAKAIILSIYGVFIITSLADYVVRPRIVGVRGHGHPLLTLVALLGGIEIFGLAGLIIAPIIMSVFVAAFRLYEREVRAGNLPGELPKI